MYKMMSGYCFVQHRVCTYDDNEKPDRKYDWEIVIYTPTDKEIFSHHAFIDGAECAVFKCPDGLTRAQLRHCCEH